MNLESALEKLYLFTQDAVVLLEAGHSSSAAARIVFANNVFVTMTGYTLEELIGETPRILYGPDTDPETLAEIRESMSSFSTVRTELLSYRKDGTPFWIDVSLFPVHDEVGDYHYWVSVQRDITDKKEVDRHLKQLVEAQTKDLIEAKDEAERANRMKSDFLANMSHELRTPMHAIISFSRIGAERFDRWDREKHLTNFNRITDSGKRLSALLNDLLDLSKLESGRVKYEWEKIDISTVIKGVAEEIEVLAQNKRIVMIIPCDESDRVEIECDPSKIHQVLLNLLSNAISFSPDGETVRVDCQGVASSNRIRLTVSDRGLGIPETELSAVFDKFIQSTKTSTGAGGTGLGLAICKEIVECHGGRIWADNNSDVGATFTVELPRSQTERSTHA